MKVYLAIGTRTWGKGPTPEKAKAVARLQGANYNRQPYEVYVTEVEDEATVYINDMGYVYTAQGADFKHVSGPNGMEKEAVNAV